MKNNVILLFSGGLDSFLSAVMLLEAPENHTVFLVHFDNGCCVQPENAELMSRRLIAKYGADRVRYIGSLPVYNIIPELRRLYYTMRPEEQNALFPGLTPSQFNCLACRTSMYVKAIRLASEYNAGFVAEGARRSQEFAIEQPLMMDRFRNLLHAHGLELLTPVYDLADDFRRENLLLDSGFAPKTLEPKCLLGFPANGTVTDDVVEGVCLYYDKEILPKIKKQPTA